MTEGTEILLSYSTNLKGKNRRCPTCSKAIQAGDPCWAEKARVVKYYPVKGLMGFIQWHFFHPNCKPERKER